MRLIGVAQQQWAPLRRKYNLFYHHHEAELSADQFAAVDEPFLTWDFNLRAHDKSLIGSVNRNFAGLGRELFTDTGVYVLRMDSARLFSHPDSKKESETLAPSMTLDQRAVMLATAVSIDFDYFSRHGGTGPGLLPLMMVEGGAGSLGTGAAGAAGSEAAGIGASTAAGAIGEATTAAGVGAITRGVGGMSTEAAGGAVTGAGAAAGMGAMRGIGGWDDQSPQDNSQAGGLGGGASPSDFGAWNEDGTSKDDWDQWGGGGGGGDGGGGDGSGGLPSPGVGDASGGGVGGGEGAGEILDGVISSIFGL